MQYVGSTSGTQHLCDFNSLYSSQLTFAYSHHHFEMRHIYSKYLGNIYVCKTISSVLSLELYLLFSIQYVCYLTTWEAAWLVAHLDQCLPKRTKSQSASVLATMVTFRGCQHLQILIQRAVKGILYGSSRRIEIFEVYIGLRALDGTLSICLSRVGSFYKSNQAHKALVAVQRRNDRLNSRI